MQHATQARLAQGNRENIIEQIFLISSGVFPTRDFGWFQHPPRRRIIVAARGHFLHQGRQRYLREPRNFFQIKFLIDWIT